MTHYAKASCRGCTGLMTILLGCSIVRALAGELPRGDCGARKAAADLRHCDFSGRSLEGRDLRGALLDGAQLESAKLTGSKLQGLSARGADLKWGDLSGADLSGALINGARLDHAVLRNARLTGVRFVNAVLDGTDFTGAVGVPERLKQMLICPR